MEFEKLQNIIADVLNIDKSKITPETTFVDDSWSRFIRCISDYHGN